MGNIQSDPNAPKELRKALLRPSRQTHLDFSKQDPPLEQLPQNWQIHKFVNLEQLHLSENQLSILPPTLQNLKSLSELYLQSNLIRMIPPHIGMLSNLTDINIDNNKLVELPDAIGSLSNLVTLSASHNELKSLPETIGRLKLTGLWLDHNMLTTLPESLGSISSLVELCIHNNKISYLPSSIFRNLSSLNVLYIHNNKLNTLPSLTSQTKLRVRGFQVRGNPLSFRGKLPPYLLLHPDLIYLTYDEEIDLTCSSDSEKKLDAEDDFPESASEFIQEPYFDGFRPISPIFE